MENTLKTQRWQIVAIVLGIIFFAASATLLFAPAAQSEETYDYNELIIEHQTNSADWHSDQAEIDLLIAEIEGYKTSQATLNKRNDEIETIVCKSGVCDFQ